MKARALAFAAAVTAAGCYSTTIDGTALLVRVTVPQGIGIDQLRFSVFQSDGGAILKADVTPSAPGTLLTQNQSVRILLDSSLSGSVLNVDVDGLAAGVVKASATNQPSPPIAANNEVDMSVTLQPVSPGGGDGGSDGGGGDAGSDGGAGGDSGSLCASGSILNGSLCAGLGNKWCWEMPLPQGNNLNAVWSSPDCQVFAVGKAGTILHKVGSTWTATHVGYDIELFGVWGTSASDVWAVGDCGLIAHWTGAGWALSNGTPNCAAGSREAFRGVGGPSPNEVYAVGTNSLGAGIIDKWNGTNWTQLAMMTPLPLLAVWFSDASHGYAVGAAGQILQYPSWSNVANPTVNSLLAIYGWDAGDAFAAGVEADGGNGFLLRLQGSTWTTSWGPQPTTAQAPLPITGLWGTSSADLVAVGNFTVGAATLGSASFLGGGAWGVVAPLAAFGGVTGVADGTTWAAGDLGSVYRGPLGTLALELPQQITDPVRPINLLAVAVAPATGESWAAGTTGAMFKLGGSGWVSYPSPAGNNTAYALFEPSPNNLWAAGGQGMLVHTDGGGGWDSPLIVPNSGNPTWYGVSGRTSFGVANTELWLAGTGPTLVRVTPPSSLQSTCLIAPALSQTTRLNAVASTALGTVAVGDFGGVVTHVGNLLTCPGANIGTQDFKTVWMAPPPVNDIWIGGTSGSVYHGTLDGGFAQDLRFPGTGTVYALTGFYSTMRGDTELWASGSGGDTYRYVYDAGWSSGTWSPVRDTNGVSNSVLGAAAIGPGEVRLVGSNNEIIHHAP